MLDNVCCDWGGYCTVQPLSPCRSRSRGRGGKAAQYRRGRHYSARRTNIQRIISLVLFGATSPSNGRQLASLEFSPTSDETSKARFGLSNALHPTRTVDRGVLLVQSMNAVTT